MNIGKYCATGVGPKRKWRAALVRRGPVGARKRHIEQLRVHRQLTAMVNQVVQAEVAHGVFGRSSLVFPRSFNRHRSAIADASACDSRRAAVATVSS